MKKTAIGVFLILIFFCGIVQPCLAGLVGAPMGPSGGNRLQGKSGLKGKARKTQQNVQKGIRSMLKAPSAKDPTGKLAAGFQVKTATAFDRPLNKLLNTVTGPVAWSLCVITIVLAGISLVFGADMGAFVQRMVQLALVIGMVSSAAAFLRALFPAGSALI